jgi:hypothetical protein
VPDYLNLASSDEVFRSILGWDGLGYIFRVHGQAFNSFRRRTSTSDCWISAAATGKFLYTFGAIDLWEWELRLLDQEDVADTR